MPTPVKTDDGEGEVTTFLSDVVLRPAWDCRDFFRILPDAVVCDLLHGRTLPPKGGVMTIFHFTHRVRLEVIRTVPQDDGENHVINEETAVHFVPSLPPSLAKPAVRPNDQLVRFTRFAVKSSPLAPRVALCYGEDVRRVAISVCASVDPETAILRYAPPTLNLGHGAHGVHVALSNALRVARVAAPAVLLLDSIHLLTPPALKENSAAVALAIREAMSTRGIAMILVVEPDEAAVNAIVRDEVQCALRYGHEDHAELLSTHQRDAADVVRDGISVLSISRKSTKCMRWSKMSESVGGVAGARVALERALLWRRTRRDAYTHLGVIPTGGVLLYGPPGTGKTLVARTAARTAGYQLQSLEAAVLARGEVGAAERALEQAFEAARRNAPTVLFIDEVDAMFADEGRLVDKLAARLDDVSDDVVVVAATNRPWRIAKPLLRAGRLDVQVHTPLPNREERVEIATVYSNKMDVKEEVGWVIRREAANAEYLSGADIAGACRRAAMSAAARASEIRVGDVSQAFAEARPSVADRSAREIALWSPPA